MRLLGLIVSTGRCGTRSIEDYLRALDRPNLRVYHERLTVAEVNPRRYFRAYDRALLDEQAREPAVRRLLDDLDRIDGQTDYIDTGWTVYPLMPLLIDRYPDKVRVIQLVRHPVPTAASLTLHGLYEEGREQELGLATAPYLLPSSPRVFHPELAEHWNRMSPFERNLFRVTEINLLGLELPQRFPHVPWLQLHLERFDRDTPRRICEFFGLDDVPASLELSRSNPTARLARGARSIGEEWRRSFDHCWAVEVARRLGYSMDATTEREVADRMRRYRRQGALELISGWVYRVGPLRRLRRRLHAPVRAARTRGKGAC